MWIEKYTYFKESIDGLIGKYNKNFIRQIS